MKREEFIEKSILAHGDKYGYDKIPKEVNLKEDVTIICPIHGEFTQSPRTHYRGHGCKECGKEALTASKFDTTETFIEKAQKKHGNKYDYSAVKYVDSETNVTIICPIHGTFQKTPHEHLRGKGCKYCGREEGANKLRFNNDIFIEKARAVHGDKYDYSKVEYKDNHTDVIITCPIHGDFPQTPSKHWSGQGCSQCGIEKASLSNSMGVDEFVRRSKERFGDKFDYSKVVYKNDSTNVELVCPIHGTFSIAPYSHLRSKTGCRECGIDITRSKLAKDKEYFVQRAREVHGERFLYDNFEYINWHTPSYVSCPIHGDFPVTPNNHIDNGSGCPKCSSPTSKWENEVFEFVKSLGLKCNQSNREFLGRQEIDVYIPILKLGIECNGLLWHNEIHKSEDFHLSKSNACAEQGINLVHIFEDEWLYKNEIVKGILKTLVNSNGKKVRAINCIVKNVEASNAKTFLEENHIDGSIESDINIGLYHGNELVSIMSFNKIEDGKHNITRACNLLDVTVIGGYKKLFEYFINTFKPSEITAFANIRWPNEKIYESLGFKHVEDTAPDYFYVIGSHRKDKSSYTKDILTNEGYDSSKTEHEIMLERGIYRIYDCGKRSYQWSIN